MENQKEKEEFLIPFLIRKLSNEIDISNEEIGIGKAIFKNVSIEDSDEETFTEVDLFDDEEAYLYQNELSFDVNDEGELELIWTGNIDDFYTGSDEPIPFKLKCDFRQEEIVVDED